jgi:hypothetical protein
MHFYFGVHAAGLLVAFGLGAWAGWKARGWR